MRTDTHLGLKHKRSPLDTYLHISMCTPKIHRPAYLVHCTRRLAVPLAAADYCCPETDYSKAEARLFASPRVADDNSTCFPRTDFDADSHWRAILLVGRRVVGMCHAAPAAGFLLLAPAPGRRCPVSESELDYHTARNPRYDILNCSDSV